MSDAPQPAFSPGYALLELLIAAVLVVACASVAATLVSPLHGAFAAQPEASDMQQRIRVGADALAHDLLMAGAGPYSGPRAGPLNGLLAPVLPFQIAADSPEVFRTDVITLMSVPPTASQTTTASALTSSSTTFAVNADVGCPLGREACGFVAGDLALTYDGSGPFDIFSVETVSGFGGTIAPVGPSDGIATYAAGARFVKTVVRTYRLNFNAANQLYQLVAHDAGRADAPVIDHLAALRFDYYGDPVPPQLKAGVACDAPGPWPCTTYGPPPPAIGVQTTAYPAGENCAFALDAAGHQVPRLPFLGSDPVALVPLHASELTDGPWCPDATRSNRFDADLLRIRKVGVTLRIEAAIDAMRGPAGALFTRGGTGRIASRLLPDRQIAFQVSPRNVNMAR